MDPEVRDSYAKIPVKEMDSKTRSIVLSETKKLSYIFKTFQKRLEKASDYQSGFRLKKLIAHDLKKYYEKNLTTK